MAAAGWHGCTCRPDHLAVVGHDGGNEGRPDLAPLGGEVGLAEDDRQKVSLDETQRFV